MLCDTTAPVWTHVVSFFCCFLTFGHHRLLYYVTICWNSFQTPEQFCGSENAIRASIKTVVSRKWVAKFRFWVNDPFKCVTIAAHAPSNFPLAAVSSAFSCWSTAGGQIRRVPSCSKSRKSFRKRRKLSLCRSELRRKDAGQTQKTAGKEKECCADTYHQPQEVTSPAQIIRCERNIDHSEINHS